MKITRGLFDHMVLQRTVKGVCDVIVSGTAACAGTVKMSVTKGKKPLRGFVDKAVGRAEGGAFEVRLSGLPTGGPFGVTLTVADGKHKDVCTVKDVLIGDVWILGGQSNMQGSADMTHMPTPEPLVRAFYMCDAWGVAEEPITLLAEAVDPVHGGHGVRLARTKLLKGMGPGLSFGKAMRKLTGVPQGLIACAHGGTSMSQWDPKLKDQGGRSLYGAAVRRLEKNGGRIAGVLFYQGESDANAEAAARYTERMKELISAFRADAHDPKLPFVLVQIAVYASGQSSIDRHAWQSIQEQQRMLPALLAKVATVPAIDLPLDDAIHVGSDAAVRLGVRIANAAHVLSTGKGKPPIGVGRVTSRRNPHDRLKTIVEIAFDNVEGKLLASGRPWGFEVTDASLDLSTHHVFRTRLEGNRAILMTDLVYEPSRYSLYYGYGYFPYCNITDEKDRALPVFGPLPIDIGIDGPLGVHKVLVSDIVAPYDRSIEDVTLADMAGRTFGVREHSEFYCSLHTELERLTPQTALVFFRVPFACDEAMKLTAHFGYDGPAKMWIDGKEVVCDPAGINPINFDDRDVLFDAASGEHELAVALLSNQGRAWGISLALERRDGAKKTARRPRLL